MDIVEDGDYGNDSESGSGYETEKERCRNLQKRKPDNETGPKKKRSRVAQKYKKEWERDQDLKAWLAPDDKNASKAKCKYCQCSLRSHLADLKHHAKTMKHLKSVEEERKLASSTNNLANFTKIADEQKVAELKMAAYFAESSLAFCQADRLVDLFKSVAKKDPIAKKMKLGRTKCTKLVTRVLGPGFRRLVLDLFSMPFSNASVERVFSAMALLKTKLRNRLICDTVDALLAVRYGLKFMGVTAANFEAPKEMLKKFNSDIYEKEDGDGDNDLVFGDVFEAIDALEGM